MTRLWWRLTRCTNHAPQRVAGAVILAVSEARRRVRSRVLGWVWAMHYGRGRA